MLYATSIVLTQITPLLHLMNTRANGASHALVYSAAAAGCRLLLSRECTAGALGYWEK